MNTKQRAKSGAPAKNDPHAPHRYERRVLLAVTGLSPQVVTETVYALAIAAKPAFVPTEIHLLTTADGARQAKLMLLSERPGWFHRLCGDYGLPSIRFDATTIHVIETADGSPMVDIRTAVNNERLADALTAAVRGFTGDPACALHVSIAGGRKTMGFYAGYALSLFGRPQDRLSHVLVSKHYESNREFFYPTPKESVIHTADNGPLDARLAEVGMAEIPFVRMRDGLDTRLLEGNATFSAVVAAAQRALDPPRLEIDFERRSIRAGGEEVHLPPASLAFLSWMARRAKAGKPDVACPSDGAPESDYAKGYLSEYSHVSDDIKPDTARRLKDGMDKAFFEQALSKLQRALRASLGLEGSRRYGVRDNGERPKRYCIAVPAKNIRWAGDF